MRVATEARGEPVRLEAWTASDEMAPIFPPAQPGGESAGAQRAKRTVPVETDHSEGAEDTVKGHEELRRAIGA